MSFAARLWATRRMHKLQVKGDTGRYRKRSAKSERMKGKRLLDRGEVGHLLEGLGELDTSLVVDVVPGEAAQGKYTSEVLYQRRTQQRM